MELGNVRSRKHWKQTEAEEQDTQQWGIFTGEQALTFSSAILQLSKS